VEDGVARGACDVGDDVPLGADEGVDERGLADVGAADDGEAGHVGFGLLVVLLLRQELDDAVEEFAGAGAADGRQGVGLAQAEAVELRHVVAGVAQVVLVGHQDDWLLRPAQYVGHVLVEVGDAVGGVYDEHDLVGLLDGDLDLLVDFLLEDVVGVHDPAAGVDDGEVAPGPVHESVLAVAGGAGGGVHDGGAALREPVEQCRLAHVGAPDYGDESSHNCCVRVFLLRGGVQNPANRRDAPWCIRSTSLIRLSAAAPGCSPTI